MRRLLTLSLLLLAACNGGAPAPAASRAVELAAQLQPAPTEHVLDEGAEQRHKSERKRWIEEMHLTPPDVDWRAIEEANGQAEMERRATLSIATGVQNWSEVGSRNLAGRMHCARLGPGGPGERKLYAGSALGGLWRGDPDGTNWEPLGDNLFGGVHELLVRAGDLSGAPDIVLAANDGGAVHVTHDLGATWQVPAGLPNFSSIRGVEQATGVSQTWYLLGRHGSSTSLYASIDGGLNFTQRWTHGTGWNGSLWVPRSGAASATHVYLLHRGELHRSTDGGHNFSLLDTIASSATDGVLTGSEAGAPHLYAALRVGGQWELYRSTSGGGSFSYRKDIDDFWESLCASTTNQDLVIHAGVEAWRSTNGGGAFSKINGWGEYYGDPANKLHADLPGLACWPDPDSSGDVWYFCTDGGLYESTDSASSVQNLSLSGLGVSQYYSTLSSSANSDRIAAGAQDQGYQRGVLQAPSGPGPSTDFTQLISGDYGHLTSGDGSHDLVYSTYPGFILVHDGELNPALHYVDFPSGSTQLWLPPVVADPTDNQSFYFLGRYLYRYTRSSASTWSWTQHSSQSFTDGGASYLSAMAIAPSNPQRYYAVNDRGRLYRSTNGGVSWQVSAQGGPDSHYFYGNALAVHPTNELQAFVGGSGYSGAGVWRTTNGGQSWSNAAGGLPSTLVYDLAYAGDDSGDVYAATQAGAFRWTSANGSWENIMGNEAPITWYWSVEAVPAREVMRFGTYGRGIWDYDFGDAPCPGPTTYCGTSPNSVGSGATIGHAGSTSLVANDLVLISHGLVPGKPGLFYYGPNQTAVLLGEGVRCVDGNLTRLDVIVADALGSVADPLDLSSPPFSSGPGAVDVGDVRNFQFWYRDPAGGGAGFNLSDALELTLCP